MFKVNIFSSTFPLFPLFSYILHNYNGNTQHLNAMYIEFSKSFTHFSVLYFQYDLIQPVSLKTGTLNIMYHCVLSHDHYTLISKYLSDAFMFTWQASQIEHVWNTPLVLSLTLNLFFPSLPIQMNNSTGCSGQNLLTIHQFSSPCNLHPICQQGELSPSTHIS